MKKSDFEKYTSAFTLSDMEIFVFPELMYSLVLANIMSPIIWKWRDDDWFKGMENKSFNYKVNRVKQFIMERTRFNLDLDTWGLTTKERELARFKDFIDIEILKKSNALFGYEGDKYYFSLDIRKHFGLDKYSSETIPYWKTETVEAMMAFKLKKDYGMAAGECVSFSALYVAALFIIAKVPLEKIFLLATPLHSQNFIAENEGLFTNNRRIVTKKMWYNGTEISAKARRVIENERVTIVSNISGYIHFLYSTATINPDAYENFSILLKEFLAIDISFEILSNCLRYRTKYWTIFQYKCTINGMVYYINMEDIFEAEAISKNSFSNESRNALLLEMSHNVFHNMPSDNRIEINFLEQYMIGNARTLDEIKAFLKGKMPMYSSDISCFIEDLRTFVCVNPKLPNANKNYMDDYPLRITTDMSRNQIIDYLKEVRCKSTVADCAFYAYRDVNTIDWQPFLRAAWDRNPVSVKALESMSASILYEVLKQMNDVSIYSEDRLALPDEAWNFGTADGIEKALLMANVLINALKIENLEIYVCVDNVVLKVSLNEEYTFKTKKKINSTRLVYSAKDWKKYIE